MISRRDSAMVTACHSWRVPASLCGRDFGVVDGMLTTCVAERDHILGMSYSPRLYTAHISIWTKHGDNKKSIEALQNTILSRLSEDLRPASEEEYYYKKHSDHEGFGDAMKGAPTQKDSEKGTVRQP